MKRYTPRNSGFTLVEMVFAMTIGVALMGVLMAAMTPVMNASLDSNAHLQSTVDLARLAEQFRRDVHQSLDMQIEQSPASASQRVTLQMSPTSRIHYDVSEAGLLREVLVNEQVTHRETWSLPGMKVLNLEVSLDNPKQAVLVVGRLVHHGPDATTVRGEVRVVARMPGDRASSSP